MSRAAVLDDRAQDQPADAAETVDGDADGHVSSSLVILPHSGGGGRAAMRGGRIMSRPILKP